MASLAAARNGATLVEMRRGILCVLLVSGCFAEEPEPVDKIGVPLTTVADAEESSSSESTGEPAPMAYGPCDVDADCAPLGAHPEETSCRYGTCAYACGNGWGDECPEHPSGASCNTGESRCIVARIESPPGCTNDCLAQCHEIDDPFASSHCVNGCLGVQEPESCYACPDDMEQVAGNDPSCVWDPDAA